MRYAIKSFTLPKTLQALDKWPFHKSNEMTGHPGVCMQKTVLREYSEESWQVRVKGEKRATLEKRDHEPVRECLTICMALILPLVSLGLLFNNS